LEAEEDAKAEAELESEMPRGKRRQGTAGKTRRRAAKAEPPGVKRPVRVAAKDTPEEVAAAEAPRLMYVDDAGCIHTAIEAEHVCAKVPDAEDMAPAAVAEPSCSRRRRRKSADLMEAEADEEREREAERGKRWRRSAGAGMPRKRAAKDDSAKEAGPEEAPGTTEAGDAARRNRTAIDPDDDVCAEEPDAEAMRLDEEEEAAALEAEERAEGRAGSAGARKRAARPGTDSERRAADSDSEDHFVGEPVPDDEARRRWPARYRAEVRRPSISAHWS
jgi:hypothetical protein